MSTPQIRLLDLGRILTRADLSEFLDAAARFYECRLLVLDDEWRVVNRMNCGRDDPGLGEALGPPEVADSPEGDSVQEVRAYGDVVGRVVARPARPADRRAAGAVARHVANLLSELASREFELNDLSREILDSYEAVNLFYDISRALPSVRDVGGVCEVILEKACEIIRVRRASILLLDEKGRELVITASKGLSIEEHRTLRIPVEDSISGRVLQSRTSRLVDDVRNLPDGLLKGYETYVTRSFISVPLCLERDDGAAASAPPDGPDAAVDGAIGVINMTDKEGDEAFTSGDLKLLTALATQAAVLIKNIQLVEMEKELRIARSIQQGLLPAAPPKVPGLLIDGNCRPALRVGGDYYDFLVDDEGERFGAVVADVSGHDIASGLLMAVARTAVRAEMKAAWSPGTVLGRLNDLLYEDLTRAEAFLSAFCFVLEPGGRALRYASAGHPPALIRRAGTGRIERLPNTGMLVGVERRSTYGERESPLSPGDLLLVYTDGMIEARSPSRELFGQDRLAAALDDHANLPPEAVIRAVFDRVLKFSGWTAPADDMTAVVLKVLDAPVR